MGITETTKAIKNNQGKKGRNSQDLYLSGYHMLGGLVASLIITKLLDSAHISEIIEEKRITKGILTGHPIRNVGKGIKLDKVILMTTSAALTAGEVFLGLKGGASAGAGLILGYTYMKSSQSKEYIGDMKG
jgi:hypothetical protein